MKNRLDKRKIYTTAPVYQQMSEETHRSTKFQKEENIIGRSRILKNKTPTRYYFELKLHISVNAKNKGWLSGTHKMRRFKQTARKSTCQPSAAERLRSSRQQLSSKQFDPAMNKEVFDDVKESLEDILETLDELTEISESTDRRLMTLTDLLVREQYNKNTKRNWFSVEQRYIHRGILLCATLIMTMIIIQMYLQA